MFHHGTMFFHFCGRAALLVSHVNSCSGMCPHLKALQLVSRSLLAVEEMSTNLYFQSYILLMLLLKHHHPCQFGQYGSPTEMVRGDPWWRSSDQKGS